LGQALRLEGYSQASVKAYRNQVEHFLDFVRFGVNRAPDEDIRAYSLSLLDRKCSHAYDNQAISAIKFYAQHVCQRPLLAP